MPRTKNSHVPVDGPAGKGFGKGKGKLGSETLNTKMSSSIKDTANISESMGSNVATIGKKKVVVSGEQVGPSEGPQTTSPMSPQPVDQGLTRNPESVELPRSSKVGGKGKAISTIPTLGGVGGKGKGAFSATKKPIKKKDGKRFRPGMLALQEIKRMQQQTVAVIPKLPFQRLVKQITHGVNSEVRFSSQGLIALQEAAESYLTGLFEDSHLIALHAKRVTLMAKDM
jgi:histone H3/H4